jgi:multidrug transporter EmrE-like cation transporter
MRFAVLIMLYVVLNSLAQLLLKQGASQTANGLSLAGLPVNARLLAGVVLFGSSFLVWMFILARENLSFAFPFAVGLGYSAVVLLSIFVLGETVSILQMTGIGLVLVGLILVAGG